MASKFPSTFASASIWFTQEEWTRLNLAVARSGKSRRRFMLDAIRAASGMPASVNRQGQGGGRRAKKKGAAAVTATPEVVHPAQGLERGQSTR